MVDDVLSQDEIDALMNGVDSGAVDVNGDKTSGDDRDATGSGYQYYDFYSQEHIIRGRMPTLEVIHERFIREFKLELYDFLGVEVEVELKSIEALKFQELRDSYELPTSFNIVEINPLHGTSLFIFNNKLLFLLVEKLFGGDGRIEKREEGRNFTPTEIRIKNILMEKTLRIYKEAWSPIFNIDTKFSAEEFNPQLINCLTANEILAVMQFDLTIDIGQGSIVVAMPYSMLEPIREKLNSALGGSTSKADASWSNALKRELQDAKIGVSSILSKKTLRLSDVMKLKAGDIIPIDLPEIITVDIESVPTLKARLGNSKGNFALKVVDNK